MCPLRRVLDDVGSLRYVHEYPETTRKLKTRIDSHVKTRNDLDSPDILGAGLELCALRLFFGSPASVTPWLTGLRGTQCARDRHPRRLPGGQEATREPHEDRRRHRDPEPERIDAKVEGDL